MTVSRHELYTPLPEQVIGSFPQTESIVDVAKDRRDRDQRIRVMGLNPDTLFLDKRGRDTNYLLTAPISRRRRSRQAQP